MNEEWLVELYKVLANEKRLRIIQFCQKPHTVSEITEKLQISRNKTTDYLSRLYRMGLISKTRNDDRTVTVISRIIIHENGVFSFRNLN